MKVTINTDCTPEEARAFLGLPDVRPMQQQLMQEVQDRMTTTIRSVGPEQMFKTWMPASMGAFEQLQEYISKVGTAKRE